MKRLLLTGGTGFIGRGVIASLKDYGYEVHATTSKELKGVTNVTWHHVDFFDRRSMETLIKEIRPTHLLHLAWYAKPGAFWNAKDNFLWLQSSIFLAQQFYEAGGERAVFAGTCAEYDWNYGYCTEGVTPCNPGNQYGVCKNTLREIVESLADLYHAEIAWGRVFFLYGPHEQPGRLISSVIESLLNEEVACCSKGLQIRDYMHVQDVASAFVALLGAKVTGPINISSGNPVTVRDIVTNIGEALNRVDLISFGSLPEKKKRSSTACG